VVALSIGADKNTGIRIVISLAATAIIVAAVVVSKRRGTAIADNPAERVTNGAA
jgi:K(+)-stimulated pyrophosphate-energized sodium pump